MEHQTERGPALGSKEHNPKLANRCSTPPFKGKACLAHGLICHLRCQTYIAGSGKRKHGNNAITYKAKQGGNAKVVAPYGQPAAEDSENPVDADEAAKDGSPSHTDAENGCDKAAEDSSDDEAAEDGSDDEA